MEQALLLCALCHDDRVAGVVLAAGAGVCVGGAEGGEVGGGEVIGKAAQGVGAEQGGGVGGLGDDGDGRTAQECGTGGSHGERAQPFAGGVVSGGEVGGEDAEQELGGEAA